MKNITKTIQGKRLDMGELALKNEKVNPIGNLQKAKQAAAQSNNTTVASNTLKNKKRDKKRKKMAQNFPVTESKKDALKMVQEYAKEKPEVIETKFIQPEPAPVVADDYTESAIIPDKIVNTPVSDAIMEKVTKETVKAVEKKTTGGLADAIAKARQVKQAPLKTPRQEERDKDGVNKI